MKAGVIEKVTDNGQKEKVTYLPHREVIRTEKTTTKVSGVRCQRETKKSC